MDERTEREFADYVGRRREAVRRSAFLLCGDWHRADDLTQTAFVALYRKWRSIRDPEAVDAYVRRCLVRAAVDESRRPWRRERSSEQLPEVSTSQPDLEEVVATREEVLTALAEVPPRQRAVLVLRFLENLSVTDTANALDCTTGTVKSQTAKGLATLRARLSQSRAPAQ